MNINPRLLGKKLKKAYLSMSVTAEDQSFNRVKLY